MLRVAAVTFVCALGAPSAAVADSGLQPPAGNIDSALQTSLALTGSARRSLVARTGTMRLDVQGALAILQPSVRARAEIQRSSSGHGGGITAVAALAAEQLGRAAAPSLPWSVPDNAASPFAVALTDSFSVEFDYQYRDREDLNFEVAETGAVDANYVNHNLLLRAHWQF